MKYNYVPLSTCFFEKDQLKLSQSAITCLSDIENELAQTDDQRQWKVSCKLMPTFFERFGSHANKGPLHFGGIFVLKAFSKDFSDDEMIDVKKQTRLALDACVRFLLIDGAFGIAGNFSNTNEFVQQARKQTSKHTIQCSISKQGGPDKNDLLQWKDGLIASNKTWRVIARDFQLEPVWDIILANHRKDFKDVAQLAKQLETAYKVSINAKSFLCKEMLTPIEVKTKAVMQDVDNWDLSSAEKHLRKLVDIQKKLFNGKYMVAWTSMILSHIHLQYFLTQIATTCTDSCSNTIYIRHQVRLLLQHCIFDISKEIFPHPDIITQWMYP